MKNNSAGMYISVSTIATFFACLYLFITIEQGYNQPSVNILIAMAVFLIIFQGINNYAVRGRRSWFEIDILFLIMFFFVHFWLWIAAQFHYGEFLWVSKFYMENVNYSVALSLLGMASFILGFNIAPGCNQTRSINTVATHQWNKLGYLIFYLGAVLTASYAFYFGAQAFQGSYAGSEVGGLGTRSIYLLQGIFLKLGILIVLISNADKNRAIPNCKIPILVLGIVLIMLLVLGDRSEFIYTLAVVMFAYTRYYKKISLPVLVIGVLSIAFLMSAVQIARTANERSLSHISEIVMSESNDISAIEGLNGISASGGVLLGAVTAVPEKHDYFYGDLKFVELLGIIPFGRAIFLDNESIGKYGTSSDFLTWFILGPNSSTGTGTTIVADLYIDFGPAGVVLGLVLLGFIANHISKSVVKNNSLTSAVVFCYFAGLLVMLPRYSFLMIIRGLLWPALFLWILKLLFIPTPSNNK
jgi:oligosaccharide repeat unit polymerase